jgi:hypothetical protein
MSGSLPRLPDPFLFLFLSGVRELSRTATACIIPRGYQVAACWIAGRMLVRVHLLTLPGQASRLPWAGISISNGILMPTDWGRVQTTTRGVRAAAAGGGGDGVDWARRLRLRRQKRSLSLGELLWRFFGKTSASSATTTMLHIFIISGSAVFNIYGRERRVGGGACGICYEFFTILTSTTLAAKTTEA